MTGLGFDYTQDELAAHEAEDAKPEVVAEGLWCSNCGYFEEDEVVDGCCLACGCPAGSHIAAKVVGA